MSLRIKLAIVGAISAAIVAAIGIIPALIKTDSRTPDPDKRAIFRISGLKATPSFDEISINVRTDETSQRFPTNYDFASIGPDLSAEFHIPQRRDRHVIDVEMKARQRGGGVVDFKMRQPIEVSTAHLPVKGNAAVRHVTPEGSQSPLYQIEFQYSVEAD